MVRYFLYIARSGYADTSEGRLVKKLLLHFEQQFHFPSLILAQMD